MNFSTRKLSFSKDKLPALAGLAAELAERNQSSYIAGLWKEELRENLAWSVPTLTDMSSPYRTTRPSTFRAPSWSWASVDGEIRTIGHYRFIKERRSKPGMQSRYYHLLCEIVDCWAKPLTSQNPFGEVCSGSLILRGHLGLADCGAGITTQQFMHRTPILHHNSGLQLGWLDPDIRTSTDKPPVDRVWYIPLYEDAGKFTCLALVPLSESTLAANPAASSVPTGTDIYVRVGIILANHDFPKALSNTRATDGVYLFDTNSLDAASSALFEWLQSAEVKTVTVV
jgi:hypothetical protein